ncbi:MAG: ferrous iron transport protein A [Chloroflexi bacterium]|nr:ferrous iron transport protein A [Chloroflexota bacterium]MBI5348653.1 ferrous iron transport protein A [Chloroflexota bacterium]
MTVLLNHLKAGQSAEVIELRSSDPARLDRLSVYGLVPGSIVRVLQLQPALIFRIGETEISIDHDVAREIVVKKVGEVLS